MLSLRALAPVPLLAALALGCERAHEVPDWPRLPDASGIDPVLLDRIREAESACERGDAGSLLELAMVYDGNDLNSLAAQAYEACLGLPSDSAGAPAATLHFHRGRALAELGRSDAALRAFDRAVELQDDYAPLRWRRGDLLLESGRIDDARADYERALELEPESVPASLGLARALLAQEAPAEALAVLERVLAERPDERFVHGLVSRARLAMGDEEGAAEELRLEELATRTTVADLLTAEVRKRATGVQVGVRKANEALEAGMPREGVKIMRPLLQRAPDDLAVLQVMSRCLVAAGEPERALEILERGRAVHPDDAKLEHVTGEALKARGSHAEALAHLLRARDLNPTFAPTLAALGEVQFALGRPEQSEASLARAIELGAADMQTLVLLGQAQMRQSAWTRAVATFEETCRAFGEVGTNWIHLAEAQARAGDRGAAEASLAEAERRNGPPRRIESVRRLMAETSAR